jgi:hypothetical protein
MWLVAEFLTMRVERDFRKDSKMVRMPRREEGGIWTGEEETRGEAVFDYHCCAGSSVELLVFEHNK